MYFLEYLGKAHKKYKIQSYSNFILIYRKKNHFKIKRKEEEKINRRHTQQDKQIPENEREIKNLRTNTRNKIRTK